MKELSVYLETEVLFNFVCEKCGAELEVDQDYDLIKIEPCSYCIGELESEIGQLKDEITTLEEEVSIHEEEVSTLEEERYDLGEQVTTLEEQVTTLGEEIENLIKERYGTGDD